MTPPPRFLLVDDTPAALKLLSLMIDSMGWTFDTAVDGEQAWQKIQAHSADYYSIIISDWLMPKLDGLGLLTKLKQDRERRHIPLILQTALADKVSMQQGLSAGAFYYLTKPLDMALIQSVIESALKDAQTHRQLRQELCKITQSFLCVRQADFEFKTRQQAQGLSILLAGLTADAEESVVGLFELMINAIEHGNLGITYDEKTELINQNRLYEEVDARLNQEQYANKYVSLHVEVTRTSINISIRDMGQGFDFEQYLSFSLERALDNHGRGIMMANNAGFERLEYRDGGREVYCVIPRAIY